MIRIAVLTVVVLIVSSCSNTVTQEGDNTYKGDLSDVPVDTAYYHLSGEVQPQEILLEEAGLVMAGYRAMGNDMRSGSPKGLVVLKLTRDSSSEVNAGGFSAVKGDTVILKAYGSPVMGLRVGDNVTFKCRLQPELVGAVTPGETLTAEKAIVTELENCRMLSPILSDK